MAVVALQAGYMDEDETFQAGNFVDFTDTFKAAAREKRFIVREYNPKALDAASGASGVFGSPGLKGDELADVEVAVAEKQAGLERWCRTHFGEAFSGWVHLKVLHHQTTTSYNNTTTTTTRTHAPSTVKQPCARAFCRALAGRGSLEVFWKRGCSNQTSKHLSSPASM